MTVQLRTGTGEVLHLAGRFQARLEVAGRPGPWFPWARVEAGDVQRLAGQTDCTLVELWQEGRRWFARLDAI